MVSVGIDFRSGENGTSSLEIKKRGKPQQDKRKIGVRVNNQSTPYNCRVDQAAM
jgi:hypothetical protein